MIPVLQLSPLFYFLACDPFFTSKNSSEPGDGYVSVIFIYCILFELDYSHEIERIRLFKFVYGVFNLFFKNN